ncbi:MAG: CapA family protein [Candidatus Liptonbacteria bacterium]|nr:CapA family protein [Candidatus Liptonbacteria bacterium]
MKLKRFLDVLAGMVTAGAVFYFGWSLAGFSLDLQEASLNFEHSVLQARLLGNITDNFSNQRFFKKELNLVLVGDVMLSREVRKRIEKNKDPNFPFLKMADYLNAADIAFGNLEGPMSNRGKNQGSVYSFRADPKAIEGLKFAGFNVMSIANNHIFDWGKAALVDTKNILEVKGIRAVGSGKNYEEANNPAMLEVKGQKVAFLAYTNLYPKSLMASENSAGVSDFSLDEVKKKISEAKAQADLVVVSWHWGEEYKTKADDLQRKIAHEIVEAGADLVVGSHPHVPEEIEHYKKGWIFYSLGNFVFDQNFSDETMGGLLVEVKVRGGEIKEVKPVRFKINQDFQPYLED